MHEDIVKEQHVLFGSNRNILLNNWLARKVLRKPFAGEGMVSLRSLTEKRGVSHNTWILGRTILSL